MADAEDRQAEPQVGSELRSAREELGFSLEDVEQLTNIHARHLEALERDDFDALPNRAWARGFLLTYANRLGLEGERLAQRVFPRRRQPRTLGWATRRWRELIAVSGTLAVAAMFTLAAVIVAPYNDYAEGISDALSKIAPDLFLNSGAQRVAVLGFAGDGTIGGDNVLLAKAGGDGFGLLSIPGNTVTEIPGHGTGEVGDAIVLGGPNLTRQTVARLAGTEVPYYVVIDAEGVRNVVDTMGGVRVDVPRPVSGRVGGAPITLERGPQSLDGDEALVYLRGSDLADNARRAERQRDFLYAMFRQALAPRALVSNPTTMTTVLNYTETNLSAPKAFQLANRLRSLEDSGASVQAGAVPVREAAPDAKLEPDEEELQAVLEETVR
ncbi:MAG: LCP family protein [Actinomycetota bacterium]|nr:LCP family protein [Actinomycetota bacterium]